ncbi:MAG TPA: PIG-L family deacetylase [Bryobacterales bacterium]|jgi:LmbE family N-acetylglucosaminyl deacetylase|nr:PIG-L family deacetylase [Bryobacterales bacterium]
MRSEELLQRLCAADESTPGPKAMLVAAHPDDEVIGAGGRLRYLRNATFVHITDGAPRNMRDARIAGFSTRQEYALVRRAELEMALSLAGFRPSDACSLSFVDQEASFNLAELAHRLADLIRKFNPEIVLTHPYEGGHPDHDAAAFGVQLAHRLLEEQGFSAPAIVEFTSYHIRNGELETVQFLPGQPRGIAVLLSTADRKLKRQMIEHFITQQELLRSFPVDIERFRVAPHYDFTRPPHEGRLHYENYDWGMTGERWRSLAQNALLELGLKVEA